MERKGSCLESRLQWFDPAWDCYSPTQIWCWQLDINVNMLSTVAKGRRALWVRAMQLAGTHTLEKPRCRYLELVEHDSTCMLRVPKPLVCWSLSRFWAFDGDKMPISRSMNGNTLIDPPNTPKIPLDHMKVSMSSPKGSMLIISMIYKISAYHNSNPKTNRACFMLTHACRLRINQTYTYMYTATTIHAALIAPSQAVSLVTCMSQTEQKSHVAFDIPPISYILLH
jgi:hypothetical protein